MTVGAFLHNPSRGFYRLLLTDKSSIYLRHNYELWTFTKKLASTQSTVFNFLSQIFIFWICTTFTLLYIRTLLTSKYTVLYNVVHVYYSLERCQQFIYFSNLLVSFNQDHFLHKTNNKCNAFFFRGSIGRPIFVLWTITLSHTYTMHSDTPTPTSSL